MHSVLSVLFALNVLACVPPDDTSGGADVGFQSQNIQYVGALLLLRFSSPCVTAHQKRADDSRVLQIPATQPLLVLATCQRSPEQLPPVLLRFFQTQSAVITSARTTFNSIFFKSTAPGSIMISDANDQQASRPHNSRCISSSSSSRVIVVGLEAASSSSWQKAIHRTAEAAANVVASAAASVFHSQLLERVCIAASQTGSTLAGQNWGSSAVGDSGLGWVRSTSGIEKAVAELQAETQHQEGSDPPASRRLAETTGHLPKASGRVEEVPGQVTAAGADRNVGKRDQAAVNKNDLHKGLQLYAEARILCQNHAWTQFYHGNTMPSRLPFLGQQTACPFVVTT